MVCSGGRVLWPFVYITSQSPVMSFSPLKHHLVSRMWLKGWNGEAYFSAAQIISSVCVSRLNSVCSPVTGENLQYTRLNILTLLCKSPSLFQHNTINLPLLSRVQGLGIWRELLSCFQGLGVWRVCSISQYYLVFRSLKFRGNSQNLPVLSFVQDLGM